MDEQRPRPRVVVCGGGVCTAYFLAQRGAAVTLVEKSSVACAASGKAGGFLALDWCDGGPLGELARASFQLHRALADDLDGTRAYGYRPLRTLSLAVVDDGGSASRAARGGKKLVPDWVDGAVRGAARTIGTVETTAQVHPQMFTRTLLSTAVSRHGVEVVTGEVDGVQVDGGRATGVVLKQPPGEYIAADAVVLALGPWSARFPLISSLFSISGLKAHSIVLRPKEPELVTADALFLSYQPAGGGKATDPEVYPRPDGSFLMVTHPIQVNFLNKKDSTFLQGMCTCAGCRRRRRSRTTQRR